MHIPNIDTVRSWQGATLVDRDGDRVGIIDAIYVDDHSVSRPFLPSHSHGSPASLWRTRTRR
jgi:hypothetical protein